MWTAIAEPYPVSLAAYLAYVCCYDAGWAPLDPPNPGLVADEACNIPRDSSAGSKFNDNNVMAGRISSDSVPGLDVDLASHAPASRPSSRSSSPRVCAPSLRAALFLGTVAFLDAAGPLGPRNRYGPRVPGALGFTPRVSARTTGLGTSSKDLFLSWMGRSGLTYELPVLAVVPALFDELLASFGRHLYDSKKPLYIFRYLLTAIQRGFLFFKFKFLDNMSRLGSFGCC